MLHGSATLVTIWVFRRRCIGNGWGGEGWGVPPEMYREEAVGLFVCEE
jgi:hypothetical protein